MCGRFTLDTDLTVLKAHFDLPSFFPGFAPPGDVLPGQQISAIVAAAGARAATARRWGLIPAWAADAPWRRGLINARAETLLQKPSFRQATHRRRCLIPADGFYEWRREGERRTAVHFCLASGLPFAFAGLYEHWRASDGRSCVTCAIVTTAPNALVAPVHDRMPAIIPPRGYDCWLDTSVPPEWAALSLLRPYPAEEMKISGRPLAASRRHHSHDRVPTGGAA